MKILFRIILFFIGIGLLAAVIAFGTTAYKVNQQFEKVATYENIVDKELKNLNLEKYKSLVLAMIYTESKGNTKDVMQSSEVIYGEPGQIEDAEKSVHVGVGLLGKAILQSEHKGCDIWTAVQAYNFGLAYIDYVAQHGKKNTVDLARDYSRDVVAPSLGNDSGEEYNYWNLQSYFYNGGKLYKNGGNFFYALIVSFNEQLLKFFKKV